MKKAISALMIAGAFLVLVTLAPPTVQAEELTWWQRLGIVASAAGLGAGIGAAVGDGAGAVAFAAIGGLLAEWYIMSKSTEESGIMTQQEQENYAKQLVDNMSTIMKYYVDPQLDNNLEMYNMTEFLWFREAEFKAYQLYEQQYYSNKTLQFNEEYVMLDVAPQLLAYEFASAASFDTTVSSYYDVTDYFTGDYAGMGVGIAIRDSSGWHNIKVSGRGHYLYSVILPQMLSGKYYYFNHRIKSAQTHQMSIAAPADPINISLYLVPSSDVNDITLTVTAKSVGGYSGWSKELRLGSLKANEFFKVNIPVSATQSSYIKYSISSSNVEVYGWGLNVTTHDLYTFAIEEQGTEKYVRLKYSISDVSSYLYKVYYNGGYTLTTDNFAKYLKKVQDYSAKLLSMYSAILLDARVYYNTLVSNHVDPSEVILPPPSAIMPPNSMVDGMSAEEVYALYIAWLKQLEWWFQHNNVTFEYMNLTAEGFNLLLAADIEQWDGTAWVKEYENVLIVPFPMTSDMHFVKSGYTLVNQSMFVIQIGNWNGVNGTPVNNTVRMINLVPVPENWTQTKSFALRADDGNGTGYNRIFVRAIYLYGNSTDDAWVHVRRTHLEASGGAGAPAPWYININTDNPLFWVAVGFFGLLAVAIAVNVMRRRR